MRRTTTEEERELFRAALKAPLRPGVMAKRPPRKRAARKTAVAEPAPEVEEPPGRRRVTREERELFERAMSGHTPPRKTAHPKPKPPPAKPQPQKTPTGLDGNTARKLKRGEIAPDAKLDLHGLTEAAAHRSITAFVLAAHKRGDRLVLVVTGKGGDSPDPDRKRGVLKLMVPRWLDEAPLAKLIAEKRLAHIRHGGEGALYVYLRKAKGQLP